MLSLGAATRRSLFRIGDATEPGGVIENVVCVHLAERAITWGPVAHIVTNSLRVLGAKLDGPNRRVTMTSAEIGVVMGATDGLHPLAPFGYEVAVEHRDDWVDADEVAVVSLVILYHLHEGRPPVVVFDPTSQRVVDNLVPVTDTQQRNLLVDTAVNQIEFDVEPLTVLGAVDTIGASADDDPVETVDGRVLGFIDEDVIFRARKKACDFRREVAIVWVDLVVEYKYQTWSHYERGK